MKYQSRAGLISVAVLSLLLLIVSCSGGGSSNGSSNGSDSERVECSDNFGDASRCDAREEL